MINAISDLDNKPEVQEVVISELNRLYRRGEFMPVRYSWSEMKHVAGYLRDNHGHIEPQGSQYMDSILNPYNKPECTYIFEIAKSLATGGDLAPIKQRVRTDNQRLRRWMAKYTTEVERERQGITGKLKRIFGGAK